MLLYVHSNKPVESIPKDRRSLYEKGYNKLSSEEIQKIEDAINEIIDKQLDNGDTCFVPGYHVPSEWINTPFYPIWAKAFDKDHKQSALWFGLKVMDTIINRHDDFKWRATKTDMNRGFEQMCYFVQQ